MQLDMTKSHAKAVLKFYMEKGTKAPLRESRNEKKVVAKDLKFDMFHRT